MQEHNFHIQSSSNVLFLKYDELWSQEGYKDRFSQSLMERAASLDAPRWAVIDDISNWPVKIPQEMELCNDIAHDLVDIGFSHCAVFGHKYAISKWMMEKVIPDKVEIKFFDTRQESENWLNSLGYDTNFNKAVPVTSG